DSSRPVTEAPHARIGMRDSAHRSTPISLRSVGLLLLTPAPGFSVLPTIGAARCSSAMAFDSLRRLNRRQRDRLDFGEVELAGGVVDVKADNITVGVEIHDEAVDDLTRFGARHGLQLDVEVNGLRIVM